jgi:hypothetical protein
MKNRLGRLAAIAVLLCFGIPAFGQGTPVTMTLTNVNGDPIVTVGGEEVYAGVYGGTSSLSGANAGIICDDFYDEVGVPDTWSATAYQASTLGTTTPLSDVLFGGGNASGYTNIGIAGYAALAYLVNLSLDSSGNPALQGEISEAIWAITDPALLAGTNAISDPVVLGLITTANNYATSTSDSMSQYSDLWIYTPNPIETDGTGEPQEMWGSVPEGGAAFMYLLLAGASCFGAMFFGARNRLGNRASA